MEKNFMNNDFNFDEYCKNFYKNLDERKDKNFNYNNYYKNIKTLDYSKYEKKFINKYELKTLKRKCALELKRISYYFSKNDSDELDDLYLNYLSISSTYDQFCYVTQDEDSFLYKGLLVCIIDLEISLHMDLILFDEFMYIYDKYIPKNSKSLERNDNNYGR